MESLAKYIIYIGLFITTLGIFVYFFSGQLDWLGKTPLDFSYKSENFKVYFPFGTMLIVSILLTFIFNLFK